MFSNSIHMTRLVQLRLIVFVLAGTLFSVPFSAVGAAQSVSFTASVDRNRVAVGEGFEITFALNGASAGKNFRAPTFANLQIVSGPNQSTNMQFINGVVSSSISYSYVAVAQTPGKLTIGPATIEYEGKPLATQPVVIEVTKAGSQPKQQGAQTTDADPGQQIGENLFLKVVIDKQRVFLGEQITATYKIYTRVSVVNYNLTRVPSLTGFWSEDLEVPKQVQLSTETVDGTQYRVGVLKKVALFPQRAGTLELDPMEVECVVQVQTRRRSNDLFDQFFQDPFGNVRNVNHKVKSEPVRITVSPLPAGNSSAQFRGAVGQFSLQAWLDKTETKTDEPVTMKVKISGTGNIKLLEAPAINVPPDIERYEPKLTDNIGKEGERISGSRTFEYLLIPRHPGEQRIPPIAITYYDPKKKSYVTLTSQPFTLRVAKGSELASGAVPGVSKEDIKLLSEDIRFIKSGEVTFRKKSEMFVGSPMFYFLSATPLLAFAGMAFVAKRREKQLGDVVSFRNRKARKMAQQRLVVAKKYLEQKSDEQFYAETSKALWGYVSDKLSIQPADLSIERMRIAMIDRKVSQETVDQLTSTIQLCEFARFAPSADSSQRGHVYKQSVELLSTIEDQIR